MTTLTQLGINIRNFFGWSWRILEATAEVESEPAISLHAIIGKKSAETMQARAVIREQSLLGLVDSGSTLNFISLTSTQLLNIHPQFQSSVTVSVANDDKVQSKGMCQTVSFSIDTAFIVDFIIIPLPDIDMVLGVKRL